MLVEFKAPWILWIEKRDLKKKDHLAGKVCKLTATHVIILAQVFGVSSHSFFSFCHSSCDCLKTSYNLKLILYKHLSRSSSWSYSQMLSFGKVMARYDRWRIYVLESALLSSFWRFLVQLCAIWGLLKERVCLCKSAFKRDRTV